MSFEQRLQELQLDHIRREFEHKARMQALAERKETAEAEQAEQSVQVNRRAGELILRAQEASTLKAEHEAETSRILLEATRERRPG